MSWIHRSLHHDTTLCSSQSVIGIARIAQGNPGFAEGVLNFTWLADDITETEAETLEALLLWAQSVPDLTDRVLKYTWLADGISGYEAKGLTALSLSAQSPELVDRVLGYSWLYDGINWREITTLQVFSSWASQSPELVDRVMKYTWLANDITPVERVMLEHLYSFHTEVGGHIEATKQVLDYRWLAAGVTWEQITLVQQLQDLVRDDPGAAREISLGRLVPYLMGPLSESAKEAADYAWLADGANATELLAVFGLASIAQQAPGLAGRVLRYSWLADGLSQRESGGIFSLSIVARHDPKLAEQLVGFGLLDDSLRDRGLHAIGSLSAFIATADDTGGLALVIEQPWFTDGLNDEETAFLAAILRYNRSDPRYRDFLETHYTRSATISLPLAGDVDVWVFWHLPFPSSDDTIGLIEDAARAFEDLMGVPFPTRDVILMQVDPDSILVPGVHAGNMMIMQRIPGEGTDSGVLYHETAHYFHTSIHDWFNEGFANLVVTYTMARLGLRDFAEREAYLEQHDLPGCAEQGFENIRQLLERYSVNACTYALGEHFLVSLFNLLGEEAMSAALRELYLSGEEHGQSEEEAYRVFLKHTPPGLKDEFRDLYRRLYGVPASSFK